MRFEYFLSLLKNAKYILGNSSSAIYEAPMLATPAINIGDRQYKRINNKIIKNVNIEDLDEKKIYNFIKNYKPIKENLYGHGNSDKKFLKILLKKNFWDIAKQKFFSDLS